MTLLNEIRRWANFYRQRPTPQAHLTLSRQALDALLNMADDDERRTVINDMITMACSYGLALPILIHIWNVADPVAQLTADGRAELL